MLAIFMTENSSNCRLYGNNISTCFYIVIYTIFFVFILQNEWVEKSFVCWFRFERFVSINSWIFKALLCFCWISFFFNFKTFFVHNTDNYSDDFTNCDQSLRFKFLASFDNLQKLIFLKWTRKLIDFHAINNKLK